MATSGLRSTCSSHLYQTDNQIFLQDGRRNPHNPRPSSITSRSRRRNPIHRRPTTTYPRASPIIHLSLGSHRPRNKPRLYSTRDPRCANNIARWSFERVSAFTLHSKFLLLLDTLLLDTAHINSPFSILPCTQPGFIRKPFGDVRGRHAS